MNREDIKDQLSKKMARTLASTLLRHLKTSESFRYQLKRLCNVLSWSVSLMYQLVIATTSQIDWLYFNTSETLQKRLKQVRLIDIPVETLSVMIFWGGTRQVHFWRLRWFSLMKLPTSTSLQRLKDVGLIQILVVTSLRPVKSVCHTQVSIRTSLRRLKLVGFIYLSIRCCIDVSNRSISFTYQLRGHDDVSAWSARSRPIWGLNETSLRRLMLGGKFMEPIQR